MSGRARFLTPPTVDISTQWLDEPQLAFSNGGRHDDPKTGITLYGPVGMTNGTHRNQVHVGFIGTETGARRARELLEEYTEGVQGTESITPFPGCNLSTGYRCRLEFSDKTTQTLTLNELREIVTRESHGTASRPLWRFSMISSASSPAVMLLLIT